MDVEMTIGGSERWKMERETYQASVAVDITILDCVSGARHVGVEMAMGGKGMRKQRNTLPSKDGLETISWL